MTYEDILNSHLKYGTTKDDIIKRNGYEEILENVVVAPWWSHEIFNDKGLEIKQINDKVFNCYGDNIELSYIESKCIGAPSTMECILPLGVTKCKNIIFIGSCGALDEEYKIGDIVIPEYSLCGDGASRYLNKNFEDEFLKKEYPSEHLTKKVLDLLDKDDIKYYYVPNISVDTIFGQYTHIDTFKELNVKTIEMETANVFKCSKMMNINVTAIFCISDNTIVNKSLFSGRTLEEKENRNKVKYEIVPKIVIDIFKGLN